MKSSAAKTVRSPAEVSKGLRDLALRMNPRDLGIHEAFDAPYGVLMDMDVGGRTATLTAFISGDASMYFSSGGGIIGSGHRSEVAASAAKRFVEAAGAHLGDMKKSEEHPLPGGGQVTFYVLTANGIFTATRDEASLGEGRDSLSALFYAGHEVITQIRVLAEQQR